MWEWNNGWEEREQTFGKSVAELSGLILFVCEWPDFCFAEAGDPLFFGLIWTLEVLDLLTRKTRMRAHSCVYMRRFMGLWQAGVDLCGGSTVVVSLRQDLMEFMFLLRQYILFFKSNAFVSLVQLSCQRPSFCSPQVCASSYSRIPVPTSTTALTVSLIHWLLCGRLTFPSSSLVKFDQANKRTSNCVANIYYHAGTVLAQTDTPSLPKIPAYKSVLGWLPRAAFIFH